MRSGGMHRRPQCNGTFTTELTRDKHGSAGEATRRQNIAIGLAGLPVPRATLRGRAMNMNS